MTQARNYQITITGLTPLLLHPDDIEWADQMTSWKDDPANKGKSKAGDDRTPPYRWVGNLINDGRVVCVTSDMLMKSLSEGGALVNTGAGKKTFKAQARSGMMSQDYHMPIIVNGKQIDFKPFLAMVNSDKSYAQTAELAVAHGFEIFAKRAAVGTNKHIRVRPLFRQWSVVANLSVFDDAITQAALQQIVTYAGKYKGLGDWRPGGKTPGAFGIYSGEVQKV